MSFLATLPNITLFFLAAFGYSIFILFSVKYGRSWINTLFVACTLMAVFFGSKLFALDVFSTHINKPLLFSVSLFPYACLFVILNIITELYGKKEAQKTIWMGVFVLLLYWLGRFILLSFEPYSSSLNTQQALTVLTETTPRLFFASILAYFLSLRANIWLYEKAASLGKNTPALRHLLSNTTAQFIDCLIFFPLAFLHDLPNIALLDLIVVTLLGKVFLALFFTPSFIYSFRLIKS